MSKLVNLLSENSDLHNQCPCNLSPIHHAVDCNSFEALRYFVVMIINSLLIQGKSDAYTEMLNLDQDIIDAQDHRLIKLFDKFGNLGFVIL
jgi:hypothetical protein